jgi:hypothetical protein
LETLRQAFGLRSLRFLESMEVILMEIGLETFGNKLRQ